MFELLAYERFRDTPSVRFFDVTVDTSNARDLVIHSGPAVSPRNDPESGAWQFYLHPHQEDNQIQSRDNNGHRIATLDGVFISSGNPPRKINWEFIEFK